MFGLSKPEQQRAAYVRGQMDKLESGSLVSDSERAAARAGAQKQADSVLQAQQSALSRQGMAGGNTGPGFQQAAQQLGKASTDAAVKASGQERAQSNALEESRANQALALESEQRRRQMEDFMAIYGMQQQERANFREAAGTAADFMSVA
jgi:hypothetical protein